MPKTKGLPFARWTFLATLLLAEVVFLTVNFNSPDLAAIDSWWAKLLRNSPAIPSWGISASLATLLIGGNRLRDEMRWTMEQALMKLGKPWWPFVLGHIAAFTVFARLTGVVCTEEIQQNAHADLLVMCWIAAGLATLALWGGAVIAPTLWQKIFKRTFVICILGSILGIAACVAGDLSRELWNSWARRPTMWVVSQLLGVFCAEVLYKPGNLIMAARLRPSSEAYGLEIVSPCSGYDAFGLLWMFMVTYFWRSRRCLRFPRAFLLIPLASLTIWCAIVLRIVGLVMLALASLADAASAAHSQVAWVFFNFLALGIIVVVGRMIRLDARPTLP